VNELIEYERLQAREAERKMDLLDVYFKQRSEELHDLFMIADSRDLLRIQIQMQELEHLQAWLDGLIKSAKMVDQ
jgi:hypothetical protein